MKSRKPLPFARRASASYHLCQLRAILEMEVTEIELQSVLLWNPRQEICEISTAEFEEFLTVCASHLENGRKSIDLEAIDLE